MNNHAQYPVTSFFITLSRLLGWCFLIITIFAIASFLDLARQSFMTGPEKLGYSLLIGVIGVFLALMSFFYAEILRIMLSVERNTGIMASGSITRNFDEPRSSRQPHIPDKIVSEAIEGLRAKGYDVRIVSAGKYEVVRGVSTRYIYGDSDLVEYFKST